MKYILKSSKEIFITYILNYLIIIISGLIYNLLGYNNIDFFLNNICSYIILSFYILTIIYLYKNNYRKEIKISNYDYFPLTLLGISIAVLLNMLIFILFPPTTIAPNINPLIIISSGIIGPIYEEILFRYILYNRLKNKYSIKKSILITTLIFSLIHLSPINIIYAFVLGLIINIMYEKHHNILSSIIIHIAANTIAIFLFEYNTYILFLSLICLILSIILTTNLKINKKVLSKKVTHSIIKS